MIRTTKILFGIVLVSVAAFFLLGSSPNYFSCNGKITRNGETNSKRAERISLKVEIWPWLNQLIFQPEYKGTASLDSNQIYLHIRDVSDVNIYLKSPNAAGREFGVFDRVSRKLVLNDGLKEYSLICEPSEPVAL